MQDSQEIKSRSPVRSVVQGEYQLSNNGQIISSNIVPQVPHLMELFKMNDFSDLPQPKKKQAVIQIELLQESFQDYDENVDNQGINNFFFFENKIPVQQPYNFDCFFGKNEIMNKREQNGGNFEVDFHFEGNSSPIVAEEQRNQFISNKNNWIIDLQGFNRYNYNRLEILEQFNYSLIDRELQQYKIQKRKIQDKQQIQYKEPTISEIQSQIAKYTQKYTQQFNNLKIQQIWLSAIGDNQKVQYINLTNNQYHTIRKDIDQCQQLANNASLAIEYFVLHEGNKQQNCYKNIKYQNNNDIDKAEDQHHGQLTQCLEDKNKRKVIETALELIMQLITDDDLKIWKADVPISRRNIQDCQNKGKIDEVQQDNKSIRLRNKISRKNNGDTNSGIIRQEIVAGCRMDEQLQEPDISQDKIDLSQYNQQSEEFRQLGIRDRKPQKLKTLSLAFLTFLITNNLKPMLQFKGKQFTKKQFTIEHISRSINKFPTQQQKKNIKKRAYDIVNTLVVAGYVSVFSVERGNGTFLKKHRKFSLSDRSFREIDNILEIIIRGLNEILLEKNMQSFEREQKQSQNDLNIIRQLQKQGEQLRNKLVGKYGAKAGKFSDYVTDIEQDLWEQEIENKNCSQFFVNQQLQALLKKQFKIKKPKKQQKKPKTKYIRKQRKYNYNLQKNEPQHISYKKIERKYKNIKPIENIKEEQEQQFQSQSFEMQEQVIDEYCPSQSEEFSFRPTNKRIRTKRTIKTNIKKTRYSLLRSNQYTHMNLANQNKSNFEDVYYEEKQSDNLG